MYNIQSEKCARVIIMWLGEFSQSEHTYDQSQEREQKVCEGAPWDEMFYISIMVVATQLSEFVKTHWIGPLEKKLNFIICKCYLNTK